MNILATLSPYLIGLLGLSLIVLIHELGHLLSARFFHIDVSVFSIGFGPKLFNIMGEKTEYRFSLIPLGGYCKMKGSNIILDAMQNKTEAPEKELAGTFYSTRPWKRIFILLAGPFANILFSFFLFCLVDGIGLPIPTYPSRIVLASELNEKEYPADSAGLSSGDVITSVQGKQTNNFYLIAKYIKRRAELSTTLVVQRKKQLTSVQIIPEKDPITAEGKIGIYPWVDPFVASITPGSAADAAGLKKGDFLLKINDEPILNALRLKILLSAHINHSVIIQYQRAENVQESSLFYSGEEKLGIQFKSISYKDQTQPFLRLLPHSIEKVSSLFVLSIKSILALFKGTPFSNLVAGPIQITYLVGSSTQTDDPFAVHVLRFLNLLAIISIAIAFMNLLPIPVTDGGQLLIPLYELIRKKRIPIRIQYYYQLTGVLFILIIFIVAIWTDISFLTGLNP